MNNTQKTENTFLKFRFYLMSLWLLFGLIFVLTVNVDSPYDEAGVFIGVVAILRRNWLPIISMAFCIAGIGVAKQIQYEWKGVSNPAYTIKNVKNENYEYLTFLTTYIIPLICIDLDKIRYVFVLGILLVVIGFIFIRMDLYYGNPTLALMGYRLYRADVQTLDLPDGIILISKDRLHSGSKIKWIPIGEHVWVAKEIKE